MDEQLGGHRSDQIDLPILWVLARGAQVLVTVLYVKFAYVSIGTEDSIETFISVVGMLLLIYFSLHRLVTGTADSSGTHYRRYFRARSIAWTEIQEVQWVGSRLRVLIKGRGKRKKSSCFC